MNEQNDDGTKKRAHLEKLAESKIVTKGVLVAREALADEPEYPEDLAYLLDWTRLLYGRSGAHMGGLNPLSTVVVANWAELMDISLHPFEFEALLMIDAAMLFNSSEKENEAEEPEERIHPVWPDKKVH